MEEPEDNIIAILVTSNKYQILPTILSRCQVYTLKGTDILEIDESYPVVLDFLVNLERNKYSTICYVQDLWHSKFSTKDDIIAAFSKMEYLFIEIIYYKIQNQLNFVDLKDDIDYIATHNTIHELTRKLAKIIELKNQIQYNVNTNLLLDQFIIEYTGGEKYA